MNMEVQIRCPPEVLHFFSLIQLTSTWTGGTSYSKVSLTIYPSQKGAQPMLHLSPLCQHLVLPASHSPTLSLVVGLSSLLIKDKNKMTS